MAVGFSSQTKFIFVTGGVLSSIGKGIAASSIGMLLENRGFKVSMTKMDPYLNVDPGTMSPFQHGEVYVLDDGCETDLDLGHYSRFVEKISLSEKNSFTTGRVYEAVIKRERAGGYLGKTVQVIPHITDEIKKRITESAEGAEIAIIEVGGTVGDIESLPFLEAIRQLRGEMGKENTLFLHLTLVPYLEAAGELKTKPTQHSVKELREIGIQPDILLCRSDRELPPEVKQKIGLFCNCAPQDVFSSPDSRSIYEVPLLFHKQKIDDQILFHLRLSAGEGDLAPWANMVDRIFNPKHHVKIAVVGKYMDWKESYKSLHEALIHAGSTLSTRVEILYVDSQTLETEGIAALATARPDGILIPGGFGERGIEGKIGAIEFARVHNVPLFGICLGMQLMVVEFFRNRLGRKSAGSSEFNAIHRAEPAVIDLMADQRTVTDLGGSMRLGMYPCAIAETDQNKQPTLAYQTYGKNKIFERHRHRFEVVNAFRSAMEAQGLHATGIYRDAANQERVEMVELEGHPWFLGCQFHPEFLSKPLLAHPLFIGFIQAALCKKEKIA